MGCCLLLLIKVLNCMGFLSTLAGASFSSGPISSISGWPQYLEPVNKSDCKYVSENEFGFLRAHSNQFAIVRLVEHLQCVRENRGFVDVPDVLVFLRPTTPSTIVAIRLGSCTS